MSIANLSPTEGFVSGSTAMIQYTFVKLSTAGKLIPMTTANKATTPVTPYVLQSAVKNYAGEIVEAAGNVGFNTYLVMASTGTSTKAIGTEVTCNGVGKGIVVTTGQYVYAKTLETFASSGAIVLCKLENKPKGIIPVMPTT